MSKFDDLLALASRYASSCVEAMRGHILHDEVLGYSHEFCTAVRLLEADHKALLDDQEELVRVKAELAAIRALTDEQKQHIHNQTGAGHALICLVESYIKGVTE